MSEQSGNPGGEPTGKEVDPLDLSRHDPAVRAWLELVKPERLLPARPRDCQRCNDSGFEPVIDEKGGTRYRACVCLVRKGALERQKQLSVRPDFGAMEGCTLDQLVPHENQYAAYRALRTLIKTGRGLVVIFGANGTGKTRLATAAAWELAARDITHLWTPGRLLRHLRTKTEEAAWAIEEEMDRLMQVRSLVLDGLGTEASSPWSEATLSEIISMRAGGYLATVVTTAQPLGQLSERWAGLFTDMGRASMAEIVGSLEDREQGGFRQTPDWRPGSMVPIATEYNRTGENKVLICPRCHSRPCLDVCPEPIFGRPRS